MLRDKSVLQMKSVTLGTDKSDYGNTVDVDIVGYGHVASYTTSSGFDILRTKQGIFWRYDCYWWGSPYGWRRA